MKSYSADDILRNNTIPEPKEVIIDKKISLLYDFCILTRKRRLPDQREDDVRTFLAQFNTEHQMTIALHDILIGNTDLDAVLKKNVLTRNGMIGKI